MTRPARGFTLVEILIVLSIIGVSASVMLPRISFYFEPSSALLQKAVEEASELSLSGTPVRMSIKSESVSKRGYILAEALMRKTESQDTLHSFMHPDGNASEIFEWQRIKMRHLPEDDGWKFEPDVIYFFADGSCSPAKISQKPKDISEINADKYILTVTGYCMKLENK